MKKYQRIKLCLSSCEHRIEKQPITLYSYDINNNIMEIKIVDEFDEPIKLSEYEVEIVSIFDKSKKKWTNHPIIEDNKIYFKFNTRLIDRDEPVFCHIYLTKVYGDNDIEATDVAAFEFRVRVSHKHLDIEEIVEPVKKADFEHNQTFTTNEWHIVHNLNKYPQVTVLDSALNEVEGDVQHLSKNELVIRFNFPFKGQAQLD